MKLQSLLLSCLVIVGACANAADVSDDSSKPYDNEPDSEPDIGRIEQAIRNGDTSFVENEGTGAVRFWVWNILYNEWRNTCSGTLITNRKVATARHCIEPKWEDVASGYPPLWPWGQLPAHAFVTHGSNYSYISTVSLAPNNHDGAVLTLASSMPVVVGTTRFTSGWKRPIVPAYGNWPYLVAGFGLLTSTPQPSTICLQGTKGCWSDRRPMSVMVNYLTSHSNPAYTIISYDPTTGRTPASGDSGSGLLMLLPNFTTLSQLPLSGIVFASGNTLVNGVVKGGGITLRADDPATNQWLIAQQNN